MAAEGRRRTLLIVAATAVVSLAAGFYAGSRVVSPADAAARAETPEASRITVPVEARRLASSVVTRADVSFAGAVDVEVATGGIGTPVVTGLVPEVGETLAEGDAVLEITDRPVTVLAGVLPMYRTLRPGMSGADVLQLEQALERLGIDPGTVDEDYTEYTAAAVRALYDRVGYEPPEPRGGGGEPARQGSGKKGRDDDSDDEQATPLPISEVVYLPSLPRRVDQVNVKLGGMAEKAVMRVSGATLQVVAKVDEGTRKLLKEDMGVRIDVPNGERASGTIGAIAPAGKGNFQVTIRPGELTDAQVRAIRGSNVKVTVPIKSTRGKVLAVPVAAVSAGPGGESRVEVERGGEVELVTVELGITADGLVAVEPADGELEAGDEVVVGEQ